MKKTETVNFILNKLNVVLTGQCPHCDEWINTRFGCKSIEEMREDEDAK